MIIRHKKNRRSFRRYSQPVLYLHTDIELLNCVMMKLLLNIIQITVSDVCTK